MKEKFFAKLRPFILFVFGIIILPVCVHAAPIRVGFVTGHYPEKFAQQWSQLLDYLSREVGEPFEMVLREDYTALIDSIENGEIDIFESGVSSHITAYKKGGVEPLVAEAWIPNDTRTYQSLFIVRKDSKINNLADLAGKNLALTDVISITSYVIPRLMLARANITDPDSYFRQIMITGGHDRSIEAVLEGSADVATIGSSFLDSAPKEIRDHVRIIAESDPIPRGLLTISKNFDVEKRQRIYQALLNYKKQLPREVRESIKVTEFIPIAEEDLVGITKDYEEAFSFPVLSTGMPYKRLPTIILKFIHREKIRSFIYLGIMFVLLSVAFVSSSLWMKKRLSTSISIFVVTSISMLFLFFSALQVTALFSSIDTFAVKKLDELQVLNLRLVASIAGASSETPAQILNSAKKYEMVSTARIFRNGAYIASMEEGDVGNSIMDRIRAGAFTIPGKEVVEILDPLVIGDRKYANLQVGVPLSQISRMVNMAFVANLVAFFSAIIAGILIMNSIRKKVERPINKLSLAVNGLREGIDANISCEEAEFKPIAQKIEQLGKEIENKEQFLELKTAETSRLVANYDPIVTRELLARIHTMELANEEFHHLRKTQILGDSPSWLRTLRDAAIRARDRDPVVIIGPTGSGKTGIARAIHTLSPRADQPFGEFNCAEFASADPMIVLGKLFGYGTDSGLATVDRKGQCGILEEYDGGTLFFDEVGLLPIQAQQLLLLPFEGRPFNPAAGKGKARTVNIRFIFATNERLEDLVHAGRMRHDLLRRIKARGTVEIAPLAERHEDIEMLARHFLAMRNMAMDQTVSFTQEAMRALTGHGFDKYNVSELKGLVDQSFDNALFEESQTIEPKHLGQDIASDVPSHGFDGDEQSEISALRMFQFNITRAEKHMGLATGSKTLTNRFRGICYRTLERCEWDVEKTASEIAGPGSEESTLERIKKKIADYLEMVRRHAEAGSTDKLFNNLPQKYHSVVEGLLVAVRSGKFS